MNKRRSLLLIAILILGMPTFLEAQEKRVALVIGNSAYGGNALTNPVNDATDIAASLRDRGFEVILRTDADYSGMDTALSDFQKALKDKDVALFYYAGHGVQAEGENYLIPVKEDISSLAKAKSKGIALGDVLSRIRDAQVKTALVFLDACRDNPFPGSSRSGTRGLAAIAAPRDVETLIAYATQPGDVAQDGSGRNGVFTSAVLKNLETPGLNIGEMMTRVKADVKAATGGKQQPRVDDGLSRTFYFSDASMAAAKAQEAASKSQAELAILDAQIAKRQASIAALADGASKRDLELQQQKEVALQATKRLEAEALAKELARQTAILASVQATNAQKAKDDDARKAEATRIAEVASLKRLELAKLSRPDDSASSFIKQSYDLEAAISDVSDRFDAMWKSISDSLDGDFSKTLATIQSETQDPFETSVEFKSRVLQEKADAQALLESLSKQKRSEWVAARTGQLAPLSTKYDALRAEIASKSFVLGSAEWQVVTDPFNAEKKSWHALVQSRRSDLPVAFDMEWKLTDSTREALKASYSAGDFLIKAGALGAEVRFRLERDGNVWKMVGQSSSLVDITSGKIVYENSEKGTLLGFGRGSTDGILIGPSLLRLKVDVPDGVVYLGEQKLGAASEDLIIPSLSGAVVEIRWSDGAKRSFSISPVLGAAIERSVSRLPVPRIAIGKTPLKVNIPLSLDPSGTSGDTDDARPLQVRWKFGDEEKWTSWTAPQKTSYKWPTSGVYFVTLEAKDSFGLTALTVVSVRVQGTILVSDFAIADFGNRDNVANPGEELRLDLRVQNSGTSTVKGLKIQLQTPNTDKLGAIAEVTAGGAAQVAGIQVGDLIRKVNGQLIQTDLAALIAQQTPNTKVEVELLRPSATTVLGRVTWESRKLLVNLGKSDDGKPKLGVSISNDAERFGGVWITSQPASYGDLEPGIFRAAESSSKDAEKALLYPESYGRFSLKVSSLADVGKSVPVRALFSDSQGNQWQDGFDLPIAKTGGLIVVNKYALADFGNRDNVANPGEELRLDLRVQNSGTSTVKGLKIQLQTPNTDKLGAIAEVTAGGAAQVAGIQVGDLIRKVNGQLIQTDLAALIAQQTPNTKVEVELLRPSATTVLGRVTWESRKLLVNLGKSDDGKPKLGVSISNDAERFGGVWITSQPASYGDLEPGIFRAAESSSKDAEKALLYPESYGRFSLKVSSLADVGKSVPVRALFSDSQGNQWQDGFDLPIAKTGGLIVVNKYAVADFGNRDNVANPGEELRLDLRVQNSGTSTVKGLKIQIVAPVGSGISIVGQPASYGDLEPGVFRAAESASKDAEKALLSPENYGRFSIKIQKTIKKGNVPLEVRFSDSQGNVWIDSIALEVK